MIETGQKMAITNSFQHALFLGFCSYGVILCGCAHNQLRWDTVRQSQTLTAIFEQQVLDNVAMFVYSPDSLPFFAFPNAGGSDVNDSGHLAGGLIWTRVASGFDAGNFGMDANRSLSESWTLTPITDPRKLELMRCAYQTAISPCTGTYVSGNCPNCQNAFNRFYTGDPKGQIPSQGEKALGVTSECIGHQCWFSFGCKRCVPRDCKCLKVGHHCGVYVWVTPSGQNELTKLTLAILDYAVYSAPPLPTRNVTWYFDKNGDPSTSDQAARVEEATILFSAPTPERLPPTSTHRVDAMTTEPLPGSVVPAEPVPTPIPNSDYLQFQQNLRFLTPRR